MRLEDSIRKKVELDSLLQTSLHKRAKEVKERSYELMLGKTMTGKKNDPSGGLTDSEKLSMIINTWLSDKNIKAEFTYEDLQAEAKLTSHQVLKAGSHNSLYPSDVKD